MGSRTLGAKRGFSLIEAMVVVAIIGIVLAAAIPDFVTSNKRRRVEAAATDLSARIQMTRQRAVAMRTPHRLVLEPAERTYRTESQETDSTWAQVPGQVYSVNQTVNWSVDVGGSPQNNDIEFESRGTIFIDDAPTLVTFTNAQGDTFCVSLVRTGRVTVRSGAP